MVNGHLSARFYIEIRLISGIGSRVVAAPNNNTTWHSFLLASEDTAPWCWGLQGGCHDRHRRPAGSRPHAKSQTSSIMQRVIPPEERHCAAASLHILQQPVLPPRPSDIQPQPTEAVFSQPGVLKHLSAIWLPTLRPTERIHNEPTTWGVESLGAAGR